jgi:Major Facilitator Superfamily
MGVRLWRTGGHRTRPRAAAASGLRLGGSFHRLWWANTVSSIGNGITIAAVSLLAATTTTDPVAIAAVFAAYDIPTLAFGLAGASAIDRIDRRRLLIAMDVGRLVIVLMAALLLLGGVGGLALSYLVSVGVGVGTLLFDVTASAVVAEETPSDLLARANSALYAAEDSMRDLVGIPLGAVLFAAAVSLPFFVDAGTFAFSALVVASLRLSRTRARLVAATPDEGSPADPARLRIGVAYLRGHRVLRRLVGLWSAQALLFGATFAILVYYALHALDLTAAGYGLLAATSGAGMLAGNLGASPVIGTRDRGYAVILVLVAATAALGYLIVAAAGMIAVAALGLFVWGAGIATGNVAVSTLRQRLIPVALYGRVFTVATVINRTAVVVGALLGGVAALVGGPRLPWYLAAGIQAVLIVAVAAMLRDEAITAAIAAAESPVDPDPTR